MGLNSTNFLTLTLLSKSATKWNFLSLKVQRKEIRLRMHEINHVWNKTNFVKYKTKTIVSGNDNGPFLSRNRCMVTSQATNKEWIFHAIIKLNFRINPIMTNNNNNNLYDQVTTQITPMPERQSLPFFSMKTQKTLGGALDVRLWCMRKEANDSCRSCFEISSSES